MVPNLPPGNLRAVARIQREAAEERVAAHANGKAPRRVFVALERVLDAWREVERALEDSNVP